ncbi:hypothetical protein EXS66_00950 [Candidatus Saccharibacteria bacterium]|nr:hypothetical protein [Candidatus Saccharibacteria bacterium]
MKIDSYRNQSWLESLLNYVWGAHFSDIARSNQIKIIFGKKAKRRLGSIGLDSNDPGISIIRINPIFKDMEVPQFVVVATIVHEMTHYAHGFNSPLQQKQQHPHRGGVIKQEFAERGLEYMYLEQQTWLKENWLRILDKYFAPTTHRSRTRRVKVVLPWWMPRL